MIHFNNLLQRTWGTSQMLALAICMFLGLSTASQAQVNLTAPGALYAQDFNGADLASTQWVQFDENNDGATNCPTGAAGGNGRWNLVTVPCQSSNQNNVARGGTGKTLAYEFKTPNAANDWVFSPAFQLGGGSQYKFIYYYRSAGTNFPEKMKAMVTSNNTPANAITGVPASAPLKDYPSVVASAYTKDSIMFTPTNAGTFYLAFKAESDADQFFLAIDDVSVQNMTIPANDVSVINITTTATVASCATFLANTTFTVRVKNNGTAAQTNFNVAWKIERGTTLVASGTQVVATLAANAETTFDVAGNLTTPGQYIVTANTQLANDAVQSNDQFILGRFNPLSDLSAQGANYFQGFTSLGSVGWVANPAATTTSGWKQINIGTQTVPSLALFCQRNATAANNDWMFSNCFNFVNGQTYRITYIRAKLNSNAATPTTDEKLRFYVGNVATEAGMTTQLGATGDEIISSSTFATITINYTATTTGVHYFGFKQTSDVLPAGFPTTGLAGTVIDNFNVLSVPNTDLGIRSITPTFTTLDACSGYTNNTAITVKVTNNGTQAINTQDFTFKYRVRNSANAIIQAETTLASGNLAIAPGADADLVATVNVDMSQNIFYQVEIYASSANDPNRLNDTIKPQYRNGSRDLTASNASYTENFDAANQLDLSWAFLDAANTTNSGDIFYNTSAGFAASGTRFLAGFSTTEATNSWASTGCLKLKAGQTYTIDFKYRTTAFAEKLKVVLLNAALPTTAGTAVPPASIVSTIKDFPSLTNTTTAYVSAGRTTFTVPNDGNYFIAFNHYSAANPNAGTTQSFVLIDDVAIVVPQPPAAPTSLTATASSTAKAINLSWTASASTGVTGYRIERGTSATGPFTQIGTTTTATTYADTDAALILNTAYHYQVKAVDDLTIASAASNVANATIVTVTPGVPVLNSVTNAATGLRNTVTWTASANATSYRIERSTTGAGGAFSQIGTATASPYLDNNVQLGLTYHYRVIAINGFNSPSAPSNVLGTTVTSLERNTFGGVIKVYPNPSREGKFTVEMPEVQKTITFTVVNTMGKVVSVTKGENEQSFEIKATGLAKGMYFLQIDSNKGQATKKIIVE